LLALVEFQCDEIARFLAIVELQYGTRVLCHHLIVYGIVVTLSLGGAGSSSRNLLHELVKVKELAGHL
jgi:MFS-type transporter involved in bile tolerance (Atg22 family)